MTRIKWAGALFLTISLLTGCAAAGQKAEPPEPATASSSGAASSAPASSAPAADATFAGLTVEAYPLGDGPLDPEATRTISDKRAAWRSTEARVQSLSKALAPFGLRVTFTFSQNIGHPVYAIHQGDTIVADGIDEIWAPSVNARGDDFALLYESNGKASVMHKTQTETWDMAAHGFTGPVYAGNSLVAVVDESSPARTIPGTFRYSVRSGDNQPSLLKGEFPYDKVDNPIKGLSAWDGHWVLEVAGHLYIDGKDLTAEKGYDEIFGWHLVGGKPFYYFVKGGKTGIVYDHQIYGQQYDEIVHGRCCSPAVFNQSGTDQMSWFYGQKDGQWSYVEMGLYQ